MGMNRAFKVAFTAFMLAAGFAGSVAAGPFEAAVAAHEKGVAADEKGVYATALRLLRPLAEQGEASAQYNLGLMFDNGQGVQQNYATAVSWYRRAAEQGHADAQNNLGVMYAQGRGVPQDHATAASWYQKAAEQDHATARAKPLGMWRPTYHRAPLARERMSRLRLRSVRQYLGRAWPPLCRLSYADGGAGFYLVPRSLGVPSEPS
jgi:TPR repeat protein